MSGRDDTLVTKECENCRYYDNFVRRSENNVSLCNRFPESRVVMPDYWCGEFEPVTKPTWGRYTLKLQSRSDLDRLLPTLVTSNLSIMGVRTLKSLTTLSMADLKKENGIGEKSIAAIVDVLTRHGLRLKGEP